MTAATDIRASLVAALHADLVGPFDPANPSEELSLAPSRWYLTGFLAPKNDRDPKSPDADDGFGTGTGDDDDDEPAVEQEPKQKNNFPASLGMSVLLPAKKKDGESIKVTVSFAEYTKEEVEVPGGDRRKKRHVWRRAPQPLRAVELALDSATIEKGSSLPDTPGIRVCGKLETADAPGLAAGTRALSLFVVNERTPGEKGQKDEQFIFQVSMSLSFEPGFVPRPNRQGEGASEPDDQTADLQFRDHNEWAVGHGIAVEIPDGASAVTRICTTWIPETEVRKVDTHEEPNVVTAMEDLADLADGPALVNALSPLVDAYATWIDAQQQIPLDSAERNDARKRLLKKASRAKDRIRAGIQLLRTDDQAREAFQLMNRAMASSARQRSPQRYAEGNKPGWRLFQLAFVLLNLIGISDPSNEVERNEVELIFFPTGGGKTEAYLGVIGFTLLLRRLRGQTRADGGLGVAVLLRYTLRLLTLDQLGRAATLICALELLRKKDTPRLGDVRFSVGLWVGRSATANTLEQVKKLVIDYKNSASKTAPSPFPLAACPWCGRELGRDSLVLAPSKSAPDEVIVSCVSASGQPPSDPGVEPRRTPVPRAGGHVFQRASAARPLSLRAVRRLPPELLPLRRGDEPHALLGPRARAWSRWHPAGDDAARPLRDDRAHRRDGHRDASLARRGVRRGPRRTRRRADERRRGERAPEEGPRGPRAQDPRGLAEAHQGGAPRGRHQAELLALRQGQDRRQAAPLHHHRRRPSAHALRRRTLRGADLDARRGAVRTSLAGAPLARRKALIMKFGTHGPKVQQQPDGTVRQSQVVTTFGPGSMVDLLTDAVLIGGLDFWSYDRTFGPHHIPEKRLRDAIAERFRELGRELSLETPFRAPPMGNDREPSKFAGVSVLEFPHWFVCQNPRCRSLQRKDGLELKSHRYWHQCERDKKAECVPVRFVSACKRGHIDEFHWISFVHAAQSKDSGGERCAAPSLTFEEGASGDFNDIRIVCACGASQKLNATYGLELPCFGSRPWLGPEGKEECKEHIRLLVRTASNSYFPQVVSALSIPDPAGDLQEKVSSVWDVVKTATMDVLPVFRTIEKVRVALQDYSDAEVLQAVRAIQEDKPITQGPLRTAEWKQLTSAKEEASGDLPPTGIPFFARRVSPKDGLPQGVGRLVVAQKLREVIAQIGFTRLEPVSPDLQGEYDIGVKTAALGLTTNWLPASEIRGEGVFVELDETSVQEWEGRASVKARGEQLLAGYEAWSKTVDAPPPFPGVRFYMVHSLAHLLTSAISLECGYAASAIRERIYCGPSAKDPTPMAALLLSTGTTGSEGTLGGLVEQGRELRAHLQRAFDMGRLCSNDPVCAGHSPEDDHAERFLEGAACHGCLFVAECSCERFNRYLDRALVVPAIGHPADLAFFSKRP